MSKERVPICLVGCGRMGTRHLAGYAALREVAADPFEVVAVCDADEVAAARAAGVAEQTLGRRPKVYRDMAEALSNPAIAAIDIATDPAAHHVLAVPALMSGRHVICEKPLGVTVRACRAIVAAARESGATLATAENYRHDPVNRLAVAAVEAGILGEVRLLVESHLGGKAEVILTPWRHQRERGSIALDMGVHFVDLFRCYLGELDVAFGRSFVAEAVRYWDPAPEETSPAGGGRRAIRATGDDSLLGVFRAHAGAVAQLAYLPSGPGGGGPGRVLYGSEATMTVPPDRSGRPIEVRTADAVLSGSALRKAAGGFTLDGLAATLFGREGSDYDLGFPTADAYLIALELADFAQAVSSGKPPEVDGHGGLLDVAGVLALAASETLGTAVRITDVADGTVSDGQDDIDVALGLLSSAAR